MTNRNENPSVLNWHIWHSNTTNKSFKTQLTLLMVTSQWIFDVNYCYDFAFCKCFQVYLANSCMTIIWMDCFVPSKIFRDGNIPMMKMHPNNACIFWFYGWKTWVSRMAEKCKQLQFPNKTSHKTTKSATKMYFVRAADL